MFQRLNPPLILLPDYYEELRGFMTRRKKMTSTRSRRDWAELLLATVEPRMRSAEGIFAYLDRVRQEPSAWDSEVLRRLCLGLLRVVNDFVSQVGEVEQAAGYVRRFETLVENRRIVGLQQALGGCRVAFRDDHELESFSMRFLQRHRSARLEANQRDARALATVFELHHRAAGNSFFGLASSAPLMRMLAFEANRVLGPQMLRVEVRDLMFWTLWFSFELRAQGSEREGARAVLREFDERLHPVADSVRLEIDRIDRVLRSPDAESQIDELAGGLSKTLGDLRSTIREIAEPALDAEWSIRMLKDVVEPISDDGSLAEELSHLATVLERIAKKKVVSSSEVDAWIRELEAILRKIREFGVPRLQQTVSADVLGQGVDVVAEDKRHHRSLQVLLVLGGETRLSRVEEATSEAEDPALIAFRSEARARLDSGAIEPALDDLVGLGPSDQIRFEVRLAMGMLLSHARRWDEAVRTLEFAAQARPLPIVPYYLGVVYWNQFLVEATDREVLGSAARNFEGAIEGARSRLEADDLSLAIAAKALVFRFEVEAALQGRAAAPRWLRRELSHVQAVVNTYGDEWQDVYAQLNYVEGLRED